MTRPTERTQLLESFGIHRGSTRTGIRVTVECFGLDGSWDKKKAFDDIGKIVDAAKPVMQKMMNLADPSTDGVSEDGK